MYTHHLSAHWVGGKWLATVDRQQLSSACSPAEWFGQECRADDRRAGYIILRHIVIFKKLPNEAGEAEDKYKVSVNSNHNTNTNTK
jgi:hypothetical protein